jgi:hypothetical protein
MMLTLVPGSSACVSVTVSVTTPDLERHFLAGRQLAGSLVADDHAQAVVGHEDVQKHQIGKGPAGRHRWRG